MGALENKLITRTFSCHQKHTPHIKIALHTFIAQIYIGSERAHYLNYHFHFCFRRRI